MRWKALGQAAALLTLVISWSGCAGNDIPVDAAPEDILARAEKELAEDDHFHAVEVLDYFVRSYPGSSRMPRAELLLGDAHFGLEEYVVARGHYERLVDDYPTSPYVEEARYKIARCAYASAYPHDRDQSETEDALRLFEDFQRDFPNNRFQPEVDAAVADCRDRLAHREFDAGQFYERQDRNRSAKIQYEFVVDQYPETEWAPKACFRIGELYRSKERWDDARPWYQRVIRDWPATEAAAMARTQLDQEAVARVDGEGGDS